MFLLTPHRKKALIIGTFGVLPSILLSPMWGTGFIFIFIVGSKLLDSTLGWDTEFSALIAIAIFCCALGGLAGFLFFARSLWLTLNHRSLYRYDYWLGMGAALIAFSLFIFTIIFFTYMLLQKESFLPLLVMSDIGKKLLVGAIFSSLNLLSCLITFSWIIVSERSTHNGTIVHM
jgi:hypothetical protein